MAQEAEESLLPLGYLPKHPKTNKPSSAIRAGEKTIDITIPVSYGTQSAGVYGKTLYVLLIEELLVYLRKNLNSNWGFVPLEILIWLIFITLTLAIFISCFLTSSKTTPNLLHQIAPKKIPPEYSSRYTKIKDKIREHPVVGITSSFGKVLTGSAALYLLTHQPLGTGTAITLAIISGVLSMPAQLAFLCSKLKAPEGANVPQTRSIYIKVINIAETIAAQLLTLNFSVSNTFVFLEHTKTAPKEWGEFLNKHGWLTNLASELSKYNIKSDGTTLEVLGFTIWILVGVILIASTQATFTQLVSNMFKRAIKKFAEIDLPSFPAHEKLIKITKKITGWPASLIKVWVGFQELLFICSNRLNFPIVMALIFVGYTSVFNVINQLSSLLINPIQRNLITANRTPQLFQPETNDPDPDSSSSAEVDMDNVL